MAIGHAGFAWVTLDRDLRSFESGDSLDLEGHGWSVTIVDIPVALPVLAGLQAMGFGYGEDDAAKALVSDTALVIAGSFYWFLGGWFAGKLLLTPSTRSAIIFGFVSTAALVLLLCLSRGPLILLLLLGLLPLLIGITNYIVQRTTLLRYERRVIQ